MVVKSPTPCPGRALPIAYQAIRHILVPTVGNEYSNAVEVASTIAAQTGALVTLVNVVNLRQVGTSSLMRAELKPFTDIAEQIVEQQAEIGRSLGASVKTCVLTGTSPQREILTFARTEHVDLIILVASA